MNILIISNMYPSEKDPVYGTFVKEFTESIRKMNINGHTYLITIYGREKNKLKKIIQYFIFYLKILVDLLCRSYDIVYVHTITFPIIPIKIVSYIKSLPLVFNIHGTDLLGDGRITRTLRKMSRSVLNKALLIVSPSNYFRAEICKFLPDYPKEKIVVSASGGVNTGLFIPMSNVRKKNTFTLGFVSRIDSGKGWDLFINAINILKVKINDIQGIMAGRGAQIKDMSNLLNKYNLNEIVQYLGPIPHDELPMVFNKCDIFVFPTTTTESLGLVGIEALSCGIPVIASDSHGPTDYIQNNVNGLLFKTGDVNDLVAKIEYYYDLSSAEKNRYAISARQSAMAYDEEKVMSDLYLCLKTICKDKERKL